jgi:hypothetical protein
MIKKANIRPAWVVLLLFMLFFLIYSGIYQKEVKKVEYNKPGREVTAKVSLEKFKNAEENEKCFKCHGQSKYSYENQENSKIDTKRMYSEAIINRDEFYVSNHREFRCTDCHSEDYGTFPHLGTLRMETKANCIDCHGGDEKYAKFEFEKIDTAFMASVHSEKHSEEFTCWMCHNPHTYKIFARNTDNLKETIAYDNMICLNCHSDITKYELLTDKQNPNILAKHEWLPNQVSHFTNVRCIECHARNEDTLIVAHHVVPKNMAVKKCESCHSKNSILYASLYKYQVKENIEKQGLVKGLFFSETSSIGPDQNNNLNLISFALIGLTLLVIAIHAFLRFKNNR